MTKKSKRQRRKSSQAEKPSRSQAKRAAPSPRRWWWLGGGLLVILILLGVYGVSLRLSEKAPQADIGFPSEVSVDEAYQKYQSGTFFLDVRTPDEWQEFHAPNTTLIPLDELPERVNELPQDQEIVVVCRSGNRSQSGRDILLDAGFTQVSSMKGGLNEWRASGFPVVEGP